MIDLYKKVAQITNNKISDLSLTRLQKLEKMIDWDDLVDAVYPHYIQSQISPTTLTVESILRIYVLSRYFNMQPKDLEKGLAQLDSFKDFALIDAEHDDIPNAASITEFISLLMEQNLATKVENALKVQPKQLEYSA